MPFEICHRKVSHTQRDCTPLPLPGLEEQTLLRISHNIPSEAAPVRVLPSCGLCPSSPGTQPSSQLPPAAAPCQYNPCGTTSHSLHRSPQKGVLVPPLREPTLPSVQRPVLVVPTIIPMVRFGLPKPPGHGYLHNLESDLMHNTVSQTQAQHAGTPPRLLQRLVDGFMRSSNKKPVITCSKSRTNPSRTQVTRTSPTCSTGTLSSPTLQSLLFAKLRQARTRGAVVLVVSKTLTTPFPFRHPHGHVLLCPHSQCCGRETRCLH